MIKKLLLLTAVLFTFNVLIAQEAPEVQNSLISKITATWCPPCGGWGWGFFHDLEEDNHENALAIAVHHSGDLTNPTASDFTDNFGVNSQPRFVLNNDDQDVVSSVVSSKRIEIQDAVNSNLAAAPLANTGIKAILDNNVITVQTNTKFFQDATGEYFVGVYVVEDAVANYQATIGNGAIHTNVLRTGLSSNAFGEPLNTADIASGTEIAMEFTIDVNASWNLDNVTMAAIIWKLENGTYNFVNTNGTNTFEDPITSGINNIATANWDMKIQPTISNGDAIINLNLPTSTENFNVNIYNQIGQEVATLHSGAIKAGVHTFTLDTVLPKGLYLVRSGSGDMVKTKRMIVQ